MSFEWCKNALKDTILQLDSSARFHREEVVDLQGNKSELIAISLAKEKPKSSEKARITRMDMEIKKEIGRAEYYEAEKVALEKELADLLRMELLVELVQDVESKKRGTL